MPAVSFPILKVKSSVSTVNNPKENKYQCSITLKSVWAHNLIKTDKKSRSVTPLRKHFFSYVKKLTKLMKQERFSFKKLAHERNIMICVV